MKGTELCGRKVYILLRRIFHYLYNLHLYRVTTEVADAGNSTTIVTYKFVLKIPFQISILNIIYKEKNHDFYRFYYKINDIIKILL